MRPIQKIGLALFIGSFLVFVGSLTLGKYKWSEAAIEKGVMAVSSEDKAPYLIENLISVSGSDIDQEYGSQFSFVSMVGEKTEAANNRILAEKGISDAEFEQIISKATADGGVNYSQALVDEVLPPEQVPHKNKALVDNTSWMFDGGVSDEATFKSQMEEKKKYIRDGILGQFGFAYSAPKDLKYHLTKAASIGLVQENAGIFALISFFLTCLGGLIYLLPKVNDGPPGIKNNRVFFDNALNRGWIGIVLGTFLIGFYILLYKFPEYITNWVLMLDSVSLATNGNPADQWFMYGFMYCLAMGVMGTRMIIKYRHNKYQIIRTGSILFFQFAIAFSLPQLLRRLGEPAYDLKSSWPLEYTFFFDYRLNEHMEAGNLGIWMIGWGIALFLLGIPIFTYFFGKRWYCSWVCGCGGLAETLGDPWRQQSDKRLGAWKAERWIIHSVLVFAVVMTLAVIYTYLPGADATFAEGQIVPWINKDQFVLIALGIIGIATLLTTWVQLRRKIFQMRSFGYMVAASVAVMGVMVYNHFIVGSGELMFMKDYVARENYGLFIGFMFAGVVGTGFYPLMGNRMWCRYGCPLAAYLGLVQRLKSRFRITTNGSQCISCGNCSTYCEMGIDVRHYAQRGQNIVRSSCVGCGICAAVCPRGVLKLENGPDAGRVDERPIMIGNEGIQLNPELTN